MTLDELIRSYADLAVPRRRRAEGPLTKPALDAN